MESDESTRFFWIDDAFGANQIRRDFVDDWVRQIAVLKTALAKGNRFVFTTRDYIWAEAKKELRFSSIPGLEENQDGKVVIDLSQLRLEEKEQILYNHIKVGDQTTEWRRSVARFLPTVATFNYFLPEIARRLGQQAFTRRLTLNEDEIAKFFSKPRKFIKKTIEELADDARRARLDFPIWRQIAFSNSD